MARVAAETDVVYGIILDAEGKVATHSRHPEWTGLALRGAADVRAVKTDTVLVQETVQRGTRESIYDFVVPVIIEGQRWGTVRIGLSKRRMEAEMRAAGSLSLAAWRIPVVGWR